MNKVGRERAIEVGGKGLPEKGSEGGSKRRGAREPGNEKESERKIKGESLSTKGASKRGGKSSERD